MFYEANAKKVAHKLTSKKKKSGHSRRHTQNEKVGKCVTNYYYLTVR